MINITNGNGINSINTIGIDDTNNNFKIKQWCTDVQQDYNKISSYDINNLDVLLYGYLCNRVSRYEYSYFLQFLQAQTVYFTAQLYYELNTFFYKNKIFQNLKNNTGTINPQNFQNVNNSNGTHIDAESTQNQNNNNLNLSNVLNNLNQAVVNTTTQNNSTTSNTSYNLFEIFKDYPTIETRIYDVLSRLTANWFIAAYVPDNISNS